MHFGYKHPPNDTGYIFLLNSCLPDNRAWRVCKQHSRAAWWLHEHCTPSLLWNSSSCSATGRWGASPMLPFPAPPPLPGLLQGALGETKISITTLQSLIYSTCASFTMAQMMIHAIHSASLFPGSLLIKPILILKQSCDLNIKNIACIILTIDFSSINRLAAKSDLIHPQWWQFPPVTWKTFSMNRNLPVYKINPND